MLIILRSKNLAVERWRKQTGKPVKASDNMPFINCEAPLFMEAHVQVQALSKMQLNKTRQKLDPVALFLCTTRPRWC